MISAIKHIAAQRLDRRHKIIQSISDARGDEVGRYILNRICVKSWGDSPHLYNARKRHRLVHAAKMRRKATIDPLKSLWLGAEPIDFDRYPSGGDNAL
jgi:hypothetical protein